MSAKFTKTAPKNSSEELALKQIDGLIDAYASLKASVQAIVTKLNSEGALTQSPYADTSKSAPTKTSQQLTP